MTGYGRAVSDGAQGRYVAEVRSVNGRFMKLSVKTPARYAAFEERIKTLIDELGLVRGSVEVGLYFDDGGAEATGFSLNAAALKAYVSQVKALSKQLKVKDGLTLTPLLGLPGVVVRKEPDEDFESRWKPCAAVLSEALRQFNGMREKEGAALVRDIRERLAELHAHREALVTDAPKALETARARFRDRITKAFDAAGISGSLSPDNLEREFVMLADKMDVSEELARLGSHFEQMDATLKGGGEVGKKLDFLTQELFREVNTVGSKANDQSITHRMVDMKGLIEKIREQVQNLE
jgi:uncharacterized protein (TIGR00255 family)